MTEPAEATSAAGSEASPEQGMFPLAPPLPLPPGESERSITDLLASVELEDAPKQEMYNYWNDDWRRFVYTLDLASSCRGECLELGANPYYTTLLLKHFTELNLTLANYFSDQFAGPMKQAISFKNPHTGGSTNWVWNFSHFNIENTDFPFHDQSFDLVMCCEIIEHLQNDPIRVLREIKRVLRPAGHIILTTPNANRLENVCRMIAGANIYDPYSGYGAYGRHNREYNRHELALLLDYCGFDVETFFSADVHKNMANHYTPAREIGHLLKHREYDLGQYLFVRAVNARPARTKRPEWLYRSYPPDQLES
jgi:SAM-dependent methyltransferase